MRPLMDSMFVSREKLAFIVDATAAPIASIVPISSWVGFEVGLIQAELDKILAKDPDPEIVTTGFGVFLETIKYRYYCIFILFLMPMLIISGRDMGPMLLAERRARIYGRTDGGDGATKAVGSEAELTSANAPAPDTPCRWWNMAVPVLLLIFYIFYLLVVTGYDGTGEQSFLDIMQNADSYAALLWGTMAGALTAWAFYLLQDRRTDASSGSISRVESVGSVAGGLHASNASAATSRWMNIKMSRKRLSRRGRNTRSHL